MTSILGLRVLVIEDESPIALMIEDMLEDMGCIIAGSAASFDEALALASTGGFDFALLDLNLGNRNGAPIADVLVEAGLPFAFASGYGPAGVPGHLQNRPIIRKPFTATELERVLCETCGDGATA